MVSEPYGGKLVWRVMGDEERCKWLKGIDELPRLETDKRAALDLEKIAIGAYSPLEGFMTEDEYLNVLYKERLGNGLPWTVPVMFSPKDSEAAKGMKTGEDVALYFRRRPIGVLHLEDKFSYDKEELAERVYGVRDARHPDVEKIQASGEVALGGRVELIQLDLRLGVFRELTPSEARFEFERRKWSIIAAYQTRNPPHWAHEYIQRCTLEIVDGIFIHPVIGELKRGDFPPEAVIQAYSYLIEHYYPKNRVLLSPLSISMRYAGPKAAVFLAIIRKNYGCTHFIVGRDVAGVGNYYEPYAAHEKLKELNIGIEPILFKESFYCKRCRMMATEKTCGHSTDDRVEISMTAIRSMMARGEIPPDYMMRPEIAEILKFRESCSISRGNGGNN
ncbi:MAG: sulfate adenylyltransferase [Candidatus Bathyarchaeia archaeon]|nr:sulfate adenylyltransferase [Candidatus Bathyarchaeota archaeon]